MEEQRERDSGRSVLIVGAGIAGLSAGCYARMNGYRATILEMHTLPGGVCTAWTRNGYTIDSCIHWLVGSAPGVNYHKLWKEVGALQGREFVDHEEYVRIELEEGKTVSLYSDADRLERHLIELAPEDAEAIRVLTRGIRKLSEFDLPVEKAPELYGLRDKLAIGWHVLPFVREFQRWRKMSVTQFAAKLRSPLLREAFVAAAADAPEFPMLALIMPLAWLHQGVAGYPLGGSLPFARAIERRFLDLGGTIEYSARVARILVEDDRAVGVVLDDGTERRADVVISAADGRTTIFDMLEGRYVDETVRGTYEGGMELFPPLLYVGLGVADPLEEVPKTVAGLMVSLSPSIEIEGKLRDRLTVKAYNFDPHLAPEGKCSVVVMIASDYDRWSQLAQDPERYRLAKEDAAQRVIAALEQRFPGIREKVEMIDIATPITWERYTGNWRGAYEGWLPRSDSLLMELSKTLPGLSGFYMIGQWTTPGGGLPPAVSSGRHVIQLLCAEDRRPFVAHEA